MKHIIARAINTENRRLTVGSIVFETDNLVPHSFTDLKARGFIAEVKPEVPADPATPKPKPTKPAPTDGE